MTPLAKPFLQDQPLHMLEVIMPQRVDNRKMPTPKVVPAMLVAQHAEARCFPHCGPGQAAHAEGSVPLVPWLTHRPKPFGF